MFREACTKARGFTIPIVVSVQTVGGECAASIGTGVVVNDEGWVLTAHHIVKQFETFVEAEARTHAREAQIAAVEADASLSHKERKRRINAIGRLKRDDIRRWSAWFGVDGVTMLPGFAIEGIDIAVARLDPWKTFLEKLPGTTYPVFKEPTKDYEPGVSLCRMGFPFVDVKPVWNPATNSFVLTQFMPPPLFPNEGILSRMAITTLQDEAGNVVNTPYPMIELETSSAGIFGQSGGPIFDQKGTVWGIQTKTTSYPLDTIHGVKQFYHVGVGVHTHTILGFLDEQKIRYQKSDY